MSDFDFKNFDKLYDEKIFQQLEKFEKQRKRTILISGIIFFLTLLLTCGLIFSLTKSNIKEVEDFKIIVIPIALGLIGNGFFINKFKTAIKNDFYKNLFNSIGFEYINNREKILNKNESTVRKICKESNIFNRYDDIYIDDIITGEYNSLPFSAIDTYIYYETTDSKGNTTEHTVFRGIVLQTKINKPLKCDILIKKEGLFKSKKIGQKETVRLESIDFEKLFEVYSDDQIEARYILTPSFMERLTNYQKSHKGKTVEAFLSNNISEENNVFFFIHTNKDNFEVPLMKPLTDKKVFYDILKELTDVLDVISELKLEQNIGL